jgi:hypothetical protein
MTYCTLSSTNRTGAKDCAAHHGTVPKKHNEALYTTGYLVPFQLALIPCFYKLVSAICRFLSHITDNLGSSRGKRFFAKSKNAAL